MAESHMEELDAALVLLREEIIELEKQLSALQSRAMSEAKAKARLTERTNKAAAESALAKVQQGHAKQKAELEAVKAEGVKKDTESAKFQARLLELEEHREACTEPNLELSKLKNDYIKSVNELIAARDVGGSGAGTGAGAMGLPIEGG
jgi:hypothetical protein